MNMDVPIHPNHAGVTRRRVIGFLGAAPLGTLLTGCVGADKPSSPGTALDFAARFAEFEPADEPNGDLAKVTWPEFVMSAGDEVRQLYEFQVVNGDLMRWIPCFCGCHLEDGHRNNRDCYIEAVNPDGSIIFDRMAPT
jgi:hypothetical protein